jgi:Tol biopolymer transport system component
LRRLIVAVIAVTVGGLMPPSAMASGRYDPRLRFRTISTTYFDIHYHQGEEAEAVRLAAIAESVAKKLDASLGRPSGRVQVILVDQSDLSNGWATPLPYNTIEIVAAAPSARSLIGNTSDWMRLVFTHEYAHIVHLSRGSGWIGGLRRVFGRMPLLYPNVYLPLWQIEGLAVHEESGLTGEGRVPAPDFRSVLDVAARSARFEPLDRASGGLIAWPAGNAPYVYGAYFHEFLVKSYGEAALRRLTDATAGYVPYFGSLAYRKVFKRSLGDLWEEFSAASTNAAAQLEPSTATRLTRHGYSVVGPRFAPGGRLYYSVADAHGFPSLMVLDPGSSTPRKLANRYLGSGIGFAGTLLIVDQIDVVNNVGLQSDLYALTTDTGDAQRLTNGARASDPDVSPDGRTVVCTIQGADRRALALIHLDRARDGRAIPDTLISEPGVNYAAPRWSPNGRWVIAERGRGQIVLIDVAVRQIARVIASSPNSRTATPVWAPDDSVLFASDRDGRFRIYRTRPTGGGLMRLEGTGADAKFPDISPDERTLVFVGSTADGLDLFSIPLASARWTPVDELSEPAQERPLDSLVPAVQPDASAPRDYSPWRTVLPRFWTPLVAFDGDELVAGAATGSLDALGRHAYAVEAGWTASRGRPDVRAAYAYDRWWPTIFANYSDDTDPWRDGDVRTREVNAGVLLPFRRIRWSQAVLGAWHRSDERFACSTCGPGGLTDLARGALRAGWRVNASRSYGYSISAEDGWAATLTTELTRDALGADGDGGAVTVDVRGYVPVVPQQGVIAARVAGAASWGDRRARRIYSASGNGPQPGGFAFGSDAIGLLRGLDNGDVAGTRAVVVNVDYRLPLMRLERGAGTLPLFARTLHGALFADAANAWDASFRREDFRASVGAELALDAVIGYSLPLTIATGAAWASHGRGFVAFGRIGRAF